MKHVRKLAYIVSHPIQYYPPLFKEFAAHSNVDLTVYFCTSFGIEPSKDPSFGEVIKWDVPLLEGYKYKFIKNYSPWPSPSRFWGIMNFGLISEIFKEKYDAVIIPGYSLFSYWLAFFAARLSGTPIFFRGEAVLRPERAGWLRLIKWIILRLWFARVSACLSIGSRSEEFYLHYGVPKERIFFTPYSIDNKRFIEKSVITSNEKDHLKKILGIPGELPLIIFVGKLIPKKRPADLLSAFSKLKPGTAALMFVGSGSEKSGMEKMIKDDGIRNVFFTGFINQAELPKYYGMSDIFAFPSSSEEVSPLVVNEAMCARLPVVISDKVPSAHDFVKEGINGFIIPFGDTEALAEKLQLLSIEERRRARMGKESFKAISFWNNNVCVENTIQAMIFAESNRTKNINSSNV